VEKLVLKTTGLLEQNANNKEIKLKTQIEDDLHIVIDENSFSTILRNLIGNAIKFSNRGSDIIIKALKADHKLFIKVIDFGTGMSENTKANLFKVDKMVTTPGTYGEEGTGLGLILCQELARLNHGIITIESQLDKGTTMTVAFDQIGNGPE
jgi:signal transduction histidine kinase